MISSAFAKQFRGPMPQEPISPGGPIFREAEPPSVSRRRLGLSQGTATEARPGMVGKQGRNPKKRGR